MHEMSLAESVRDRRGDGAREPRVRAVRLEIGRLAQVEPEALRFAFDVVKRGASPTGARLEIVETEAPPGAWVLGSGDIARLGDPCPRCGSYQLQVTGGTECG